MLTSKNKLELAVRAGRVSIEALAVVVVIWTMIVLV